ncbi:MAG: hypothetical protein KGH63_01515 [Candidatus Micrarchaeota archaeon]|nr:hypothetical protein [Candidatus Micrarchaeota archaeon]
MEQVVRAGKKQEPDLGQLPFVQKVETVRVPIADVQVQFKPDGIPVQMDAKLVSKVNAALKSGGPLMLTIRTGEA